MLSVVKLDGETVWEEVLRGISSIVDVLGRAQTDCGCRQDHSGLSEKRSMMKTKQQIT